MSKTRSWFGRIAIAALAAALLPLQGLASPPSAEAAPCTAYEFIGARGSGEAPHNTTGTDADYDEDSQYGMGDRVGDVYDILAEKIQTKIGAGQLSAHGVRYPAQGVGGTDFLDGAGAFLHIKVLGAYTDSVREGTADTLAEINRVHAACPATKFFLAGYSQGAQAVGDALQKLSSTQLSWIAGAAFFGDPYFNAASWSSQASDSKHYGVLGVRDEWPSQLRGRVFSYCHTHDPICGISKKQHIWGDGDIYYRDFPWFRGAGPHGDYVPAGDTEAAAIQLAGLVGVKPTVTGSVPLDLVFVIDSTGSMAPIIDAVKSNVTTLANTIASTSSNYRFALVDYKDAGDAYQARVDLGFTTDVTAFGTAVASISASGGGDTPESVYSGVMTALNLPWRPGVRKIVVPIGDAPGKDPEPVTGFTLAQVVAKAFAVDPAQIYPLAIAGDSSATAFLQAMADGTGGVLTSSDAADLIESLKAVIVQAGSAPTADAGGPYEGTQGDPVLFTAGGSRPGSDFIVRYDWDWDSDGTYDSTTPDPVIEHTFTDTGVRSVTLKATDASGLAGTATSSVDIAPLPAARPATPVDLVALSGDHQITLKWIQPHTAGVAEYFVIRDGTGTVIDAISAQPDGSAPPSWNDLQLDNGIAHTYTVTAGNKLGESPAAGPVAATPHEPFEISVRSLTITLGHAVKVQGKYTQSTTEAAHCGESLSLTVAGQTLRASRSKRFLDTCVATVLSSRGTANIRFRPPTGAWSATALYTRSIMPIDGHITIALQIGEKRSEVTLDVRRQGLAWVLDSTS